jgi:3-methyladenine DNA glycosylase AlkD
MNTVGQVLDALQKKGNDQTRKTYLRHGMPQDMYGVKVGDLKVVAKHIKGNQSLALELWDTGNFDAMYLAGLVADGAQMTKQQLDSWAKGATCYMLSEYAVAWVASESPHARDLAHKWIGSKNPQLQTAGWSTYAALVSVRDDAELDLDEIKQLLGHVAQHIHAAHDRVRYTMNGFVIAVGSYVRPLLAEAKRVAKQIGKVEVDMGDTACRVPLASEYIAKVESLGRVGKKRKTAKC